MSKQPLAFLAAPFLHPLHQPQSYFSEMQIIPLLKPFRIKIQHHMAFYYMSPSIGLFKGNLSTPTSKCARLFDPSRLFHMLFPLPLNTLPAFSFPILPTFAN